MSLVAAARPVTIAFARESARVLLHGGPAVRIAIATLVASTVTMCSYWAQSSGRPAAAPLPASEPLQQSTAKSDRLDAYVREERAAGTMLDAPAKLETSGSVAWPINDRVTAGLQVGPRGERAYGIRISVPVGTPVRAAADGVVDFAGNAQDGYGNKIVIKHGAISSMYAHISEILVAAKAKVRKGQVIAKSGQTGFATSPRLYLGLLGADPSVDPIKFFAKTSTIERKPAKTAAGTAPSGLPMQERPPIPPSDIPLLQRGAAL